MAQRNELIAYALDFASYLISKTEKIDKIILHGSIARDDFDEESDIDLFIDTREKIEKKVQKIADDYYKTKKFKEWELKGITNEFSIITGDIDSDEWKDLKRSIINTGILLYGKYRANIEKSNQYVLFSFENIKPESKRVSVSRKLFGFSVGAKKFPGLVEKMKAIRIGKGSIIAPIEHALKLKKYFQGKKVAVKLIDIWSDAKFE